MAFPKKKTTAQLNKRIDKYGVQWEATNPPLWIEMCCIQRGGQWKLKSGKMAGEGLLAHFKRAISILWPEITWHAWFDLVIENYLAHRTIIIIGPASSGKTFSAAICLLMDYFCFPTETTGIVCSTTRDRLEDRIFGELKKYHRLACQRYSWLPGHLIEGKQRIVTDDRSEAEEGRDFRNGIVGVPCLTGGTFTGLANFVGLKNKRVRLVGDELSMLPRAFVDAISNLDKNPDFKLVGLGNPKETTDALGVLGEPAAFLGGWDGGIDQTPITKSWQTRRADGICLQLVGTDSPNLDGKLGIPLITQEQIDRDVSFYGKDSIWFSMMNQGMMPRGQGSRRVITRQMCQKFGALNDPLWLNSRKTKIAFLDAAYRAVGGDRCVFGELDFGEESKSDEPLVQSIVDSLLKQNADERKNQQILALVDTLIVPIRPGDLEQPEDQIVAYVKAQCEQRGILPENFYFDSGMRTSLVSAFARLWSPNVNPVDCGGKPTEQKVSENIDVRACDYYSKKITQIWYSVRLIIEAGQFRGMTEDVMMEFAAREWTMVGANKIEVEAKDKMKLKTGRSPDLADAVAIGCWGAVAKGFVIRRLATKEAAQQDHHWKKELREKAKTIWHGSQLVHT